jgi:DICT domain-containing protein
VDEPSRKVNVARPASDVKRKVTGNWKLDLVIDQTGAVRDVRVAERPKVDPEWPELEAHVLAGVKAARIGPARVDGQPWPYCTTVTVKD